MTGPKREYPQFKFDSFNLENGLVRVVLDEELALSGRLVFAFSRIFCGLLIIVIPFYLHRNGLARGIKILLNG
jgi:hypothetical protein